jgi:hypothetical protein
MADQDTTRYEDAVTAGTRRISNDDLPADALQLPAVLNVSPYRSKA